MNSSNFQTEKIPKEIDDEMNKDTCNVNFRVGNTPRSFIMYDDSLKYHKEGDTWCINTPIYIDISPKKFPLSKIEELFSERHWHFYYLKPYEKVTIEHKILKKNTVVYKNTSNYTKYVITDTRYTPDIIFKKGTIIKPHVKIGFALLLIVVIAFCLYFIYSRNLKQ